MNDLYKVIIRPLLILGGLVMLAKGLAVGALIFIAAIFVKDVK